MRSRTRLLSFGAAALLVVLGVVAGALLDGVTGEAVAIALVAVGAIAIVSLVFLEVGLSEDRERARERGAPPPRRPARRRRRPD